MISKIPSIHIKWGSVLYHIRSAKLVLLNGMKLTHLMPGCLCSLLFTCEIVKGDSGQCRVKQAALLKVLLKYCIV